MVSHSDSSQHPGTVLRKRFMGPHGLDVETLAADLGLPVNRLEDVLAGQRSITADMALRLARYFGTSPLYWMNLQSRFDLHVTGKVLAQEIERDVRPRLTRDVA
ncbi:HigA family addiction module antidote protein [Roseospira marina]|uniref:HigA family addiction module antidote protein n=1 Tax=Roseospira marina TaxID=140057 RepID=A0A5M6IA61_9PROT|nr:HigA family addiction module antitoxin [Roseospira marina]KAA5605083.1 HigA family addiction module antidote protein [Roseospira marina]MBB4314829.1 addiction module HigA family antidote [Roseospira marina]MBB5087829.1 addiction module HigA family antidote [Roseospira marina]